MSKAWAFGLDVSERYAAVLKSTQCLLRKTQMLCSLHPPETPLVLCRERRASERSPQPDRSHQRSSVFLVLREGEMPSRYSLQVTEYVGERHFTPYSVYGRGACPVTASARDSGSVRLNCHFMAMRVNCPLGQFARNRPVLWSRLLVPPYVSCPCWTQHFHR